MLRLTILVLMETNPSLYWVLKYGILSQKNSLSFSPIVNSLHERPRLLPTQIKLGDSRNYMSSIPVPSSAKRVATQILVIAELIGRKDFILRVFVCDIIRSSKELPVQS